ncbi:MAG TPA: AFG1/ZapE family ATPase, partial [Sphingomonadaceae bacterium]|nr:AFG1/ZapE family ATPase [Sphingomonadaceae bacterium]
MPGMLARYEALVAAGELKPDQDQKAAVDRLAALQMGLEWIRPSQSWFHRLIRLPAPSHPATTGIYLWGGVGRGKSMLMDLFYQTLESDKKRRVHFHAFMLEVHRMLREEREKEAGDPIAPVAERIAEG